MAKVKVYKKTKSKNSTGITEEQIKKAILQAYHKIEQQKLQKKIEEKKEWRTKVGIKEKIFDGSKVKCFILNLLNDLSLFFKIMFIKKQNIIEGLATTGLIKMALHLIFSLLKWMLLLLAIAWIYIFCIEACSKRRIPLELISYTFIAFMFSRLFRIAAIEVEIIEDKDYLVAVFSCITSLAAAIIAIIALVK